MLSQPIEIIKQAHASHHLRRLKQLSQKLFRQEVIERQWAVGEQIADIKTGDQDETKDALECPFQNHTYSLGVKEIVG